MTKYTSKHGIVSKAPFELYMAFVDMRNFAQMIPEDKRAGVNADYDHISATVQGFSIGLKVTSRIPYSRVEFADDGAPFHFEIALHFDSASDPLRTDFWIEAEADLNLMMKMMIGGKIQQGMDKIVDALVDISEGKVPEGVDMSKFPGFGRQ